MRRASIIQLRKAVRELEKGETLYVNIIALSERASDEFVEMVKAGIIVPEPNETKKIFVEAAWDKALKGEFLAPQNTYIKA